MTNLDWWNLASLSLNAIWFMYAMFQARWLRQRALRIENNIFEVAPAIHADALYVHFQKKRNQAGIMLMQTVTQQLQEKRAKKSTIPSP